MARNHFFTLEFYPSAEGTSPSLEELRCEILRGPIEVQPFETWRPGAPFPESSSSALRYSLYQREATIDVCLAGDDSEAVRLALTLLQTTTGNASLQADHRPVLSQIDGSLRVDLQRFWTAKLLQLVRAKRDFVRARVLYDFPECGLEQIEPPDPNWGRSTAPEMYLQRPVLPAIVIGGPALLTPQGPPWVHFFHHQHGGESCLQFPCSGAVLPLQLNREVARLDPAELLDGLEAMAEDPDEAVLRDYYPSLRPLTDTRGDPYSKRQLDDLHEFVSRSFRLPNFSFGREALLEFDDCDPLDWFAGWQMVQYGSDATMTFSKETHQQFQEWYGSKLHCYFLWNNSD